MNNNNLNTSITTTNTEKEMIDLNDQIVIEQLCERKKIQPGSHLNLSDFTKSTKVAGPLYVASEL